MFTEVSGDFANRVPRKVVTARDASKELHRTAVSPQSSSHSQQYSPSTGTSRLKSEHSIELEGIWWWLEYGAQLTTLGK